MTMTSKMQLTENGSSLVVNAKNQNNIERELSIQKAIFKCIDEFSSFCFSAGAGSGKTYALIETLKYILKSKLRTLEVHNQQVVCITYTNVAVREIKKRLGLSGTILISTIHERMWELIGNYQRELISIHAEKLIKEIDSITQEITEPNSRKFSKFSQLLNNNEFKDFLIKTQDEYKPLRDLSASEFRTQYQRLASSMACIDKEVLSNVGNFKDFLDKRYKQMRYVDCQERITNGKEKKVTYDSRSNSDQLDRMRFSHDTLLEYALLLIIKHPTLQRLIVDKFPYFLVDEYQDTQSNVVKILCTLKEFAEKNNKQWLVGYFGDTAQKIYGDGVGNQITTLHPDLTPITKVFNRRSHTQIIKIANSIRNDEIKQEPFDIEKSNGTVGFYCLNGLLEINTQKIIFQFLTDYKASISSKEGDDTIHCLVLTNKLAAELNGFGSIYQIVEEAKAIYWSDLNTKLLSNDLEKLAPTLRLIYTLVQLYQNIHSSTATYYDILGSVKTPICFKDMSVFLKKLKQQSPKTLGDLIDSFSGILVDFVSDANLRMYILRKIATNLGDSKNTLTLKEYYIDNIRNFMNNESSQEEIETENYATKLLNIELTYWELWVDFINGVSKGNKPIFHTYHGTKGEEYNNVAIIMEKGFGRLNPEKFKKFFNYIANDSFDTAIADIEDTQNLLYVSCSRAIKNLKVLYLNDISEIEDGVLKIFKEIIPYQVSSEG